MAPERLALHEEAELMSRYATAQMMLVWSAAVLCALSANPGWASAPTEQLRTDLIANIDELGDVLPQLLPRGLYPRPAPELADGLPKLRAALAAWEPPARVPDELSRAAMELIAAMLRAAYSPPAPPEREGPRRPSVDEQGLPLPRGGMKLLHNAPAGALVCVVDPEPVPGRFPTKRVFVRRYDEPIYREVVFEGERLAPSDVVTCASAPLAFAHAYLVSKDASGANDGGLYRIELPDGAPTRIHQGASGGAWISSLLGASADGSTLYVVAAGARPSGPASCSVGYGLASLDVESGALVSLAPMPGMFA